MPNIKTLISRDGPPIPLGTLTRALLFFLLVLTVLITAGALSQAQSNFTVIHTFTGPDGSGPMSGPTLDRYGNLYGEAGDSLYELEHVNGSWILHSLYSFRDSNDGDHPNGGVIFGPDGTLFGVTEIGGGGTLFNVRRPTHVVCSAALCPWTKTTLHSFAGAPSDGAEPYGNVVFDSQGNLYGTTYEGGMYDGGTVYKATRSRGTWNVSVIYSFNGSNNDAYYPFAGVVLDSAGNLYGITLYGGTYGWGTVFELSPSGEGWTSTILHSFSFTEGAPYPLAGLALDRTGNLYGATEWMIFQLSSQGVGWNFTPIHTLSGGSSTLTIDAAGNLYGANLDGGPYYWGNIFELSPSSAGEWTYADLYDFTGGNDGYRPYAGVAVTGPGGYLYGTTIFGGTNDDGVIYQINLGAH